MIARRSKAVDRRLAFQASTSEGRLSYPKISICLVTYNSEEWIDRWFKAIKECGYPKHKISFSIVDNASTDNTIAVLEKNLSELHGFDVSTLHKSEHNLGFGAGQNIAVANTTNEYMLIINPDAFLIPGSLKNAVDYARDDESKVCAWEFSQLPFEHPKYYDPVSLETSWNSHACVLFKKSSFQAVGGYDTSLFMYGEDVDLSYKLRRAGYRLRYLPMSKVHHDSFEEHGRRSEQSARVIAANLCLRRRYGNLSDKLVGYIMLWRSISSKHEKIKKTTLQAWAIYKENRSNFRPLKRGTTFFPFNGFGYDRRRPGARVKLELEKEETPKISVITRIHKESNLLRNALVSVKNQTYSNIEHILVFDACSPYFVSDQLIVESSFQTRSEAANAGVSASTGDYILFLDYDDVLFSDHIEGLLYKINSNPDAACAYAYSWEGLSDKNHTGQDKSLRIANGMEAEFSMSKLYEQNFFAIQSLLIKKVAFNKVGGFNDKLDSLEDWDLWQRLLHEGDFVCYPKVSSIFYTPAGLFSRIKRTLNMLP